MSGIWTVEGIKGATGATVVDEDGQEIRRFHTRGEAEAWLELQQEAAEMQALHGDEE